MSIQLNSNDGHSFVIPKDICSISQHIKNTLDISDQYEELPVMDLVQISGANLEIIVNFMREYSTNPFPELTRTTQYDTIPEYYRQMLESTRLITNAGDLSDVTLMNIMIGANSLEMDCLTSLIAYYMAHVIRDKPLRERYVLFGLPADHIAKPEDIDQIRKDYAYAFADNNDNDNDSDNDSDSDNE